MQHLLWIALVSLGTGWIAKMILPGRDPNGMVITVLLGLGGSAVAEVFGRAAGWYKEGESASFFASVVGASILLTVYRALAHSLKPRNA